VDRRGARTEGAHDLETFELPAMRQAGVRFASGGPTIVLFAKTGFKDTLVDAVNERADVVLIDADRLVRDLTGTTAPR
jgi:hypothetical protein